MLCLRALGPGEPEHQPDPERMQHQARQTGPKIGLTPGKRLEAGERPPALRNLVGTSGAGIETETDSSSTAKHRLAGLLLDKLLPVLGRNQLIITLTPALRAGTIIHFGLRPPRP